MEQTKGPQPGSSGVTTVPPAIVFAQNRAFYTMVTTFLASSVGLGPMFDPRNPLGLNRNQAAVFTGRVQPRYDMRERIWR
jgi:hypothetical protein